MQATITSWPPSGDDAPADVAEVRVRDVLDLRQIRAGQPDERRVRVGRLERPLDVVAASTPGRSRA